ncbi:MAG: TIM barrel protein [archaeon]|nr:TIM barrel protein [archaeon]
MAGKEYLYGGNTYSLNPTYSRSFSEGPIGYIGSVSELGTSVDARTANQVKEVSEHLNTGIKTVEVSGIMPEVLDAMPNEQFTELNRLAKLTGAELTFHGPMIDPTGITQQGWTKLDQDMAERQMLSAVKRAQELNPQGNTNVTFHAATLGVPGSELIIKEEGKENPIIKRMMIIDPTTGKITGIQEKERFFPATSKDKIGDKIEFNPTEELKRLNEEQWSQKLSNISYYTHNAENMLKQSEQLNEQMDGIFRKYSKENWEDFSKDKNIPDKQKQEIINIKKSYESQFNHGGIMFRDAYRNMRDLYDEVYGRATPEHKLQLNKFANKISPDVDKINEITKDPKKLKEFSDKIEYGLEIMRDIQPQMFMPIKEFAIEKAAETFSNIAFKAYEKVGKNTPILSIENHPAYNSLLSTGPELKAVIEKARTNFEKKAVEKGVLSESEAKYQSEKLIGATWDVGHINMLKKYGYSDKDIIKQTEEIAPFVKKVHLSDNFGYEHTELPMGMGNVPIKEMMKKLGDKGFEGPKIVEALHWWQHFSQGGKTNPPFVPTLQAFGVPMSSGGGNNWNQVYGVPGSYFGGYGTMLPEQNFQMYGAGFSSLPTELGGQMANKDSRFSGTPMS